MDDERLTGSLRPVVQRAIDEAKSRGASAVEAEHLLLALTADRRGAASVILDEVGLDHSAILAALRGERARSLAVVGISAETDDRLTSTQRESRPGWGASARDALTRSGRRRSGERGFDRDERGFDRDSDSNSRGFDRRFDRGQRGGAQRGGAQRGGARGQHRHRLDELDLLAGILGAQLGTVPRALEMAGIDRAALLARVEEFAS